MQACLLGLASWLAKAVDLVVQAASSDFSIKCASRCCSPEVRVVTASSRLLEHLATAQLRAAEQHVEWKRGRSS